MLSRGPVHIALGITLVLTVSAAGTAAVIPVSEAGDAVPPVPGSLRWAIELSNTNGEPDEIQVIIDIDRIVLVAPLPALTEGGLTIGTPPNAVAPAPVSGALVLDGNGTVSRALVLRSARNTIAELDFEGFVGPEMVLVSGPAAGGNLIAGCGFFGAGDGLDLAGIRIAPSALGGPLPRDVVVRHSMFDGLTSGVVVEAPTGPTTNPSPLPVARLSRNGFGLDPSTLQPTGAGNGIAIDARGGPVVVQDNELAGPGRGILLDGAHRSHLVGNNVGATGASLDCAALSGPGIEVRASDDVVLDGNQVLCNQTGLVLGTGTSGALINRNVFGSLRGGTGNAENGIRVDGATGSRIRANLVARNGAAGIAITPDLSSIDPGTVISCNRIVANAGQPILAPGLPTLPPLLTAAGPLEVQGSLPASQPGWVELFGDEGQGPEVFQGATAVDTGALTFTHRLPVLGLEMRRGTAPNGAAIVFSVEDPQDHVATSTDRSREETSEASGPLGSAPDGPVYDVVRGKVEALAQSGGGGVDLGAVVCLAHQIAGDELPVSDDTLPSPGHAFFYLARRTLLTGDAIGTYDPAMCLTDLRGFPGDRQAASGDCGS